MAKHGKKIVLNMEITYTIAGQHRTGQDSTRTTKNEYLGTGRKGCVHIHIIQYYVSN